MSQPQSSRFVAIGECMVELSVAGDGLYRRGFAGDTFNTAWHFARHAPAGWQAAYLTGLGTDEMSAEMLGFFAANGIETDAVRRIEGAAPGLYMIHLKDGERSFSYWREMAAAKRLAADENHLEQVFAAGDAFYFSGITLAILPKDDRDRLLRHLAAAKAGGKMVAFDPNIRPRLWPDMATARQAVEAAARVSTHCIPSFDDERATFGDETSRETAARYRSVGVGEVVVKDGASAALVSWDGGREQVPSTKPAEILDTTGAGDSFNAAYLAARLRGAGPVAATIAGHRLASRVVGGHGALVE
ncbi:sugar kinase [Jiella pelagia]|uniref:Sugar kinase n=1 Tax=Jiella pelagia TaxID=2986949 RepID=A0ABY7BVR1_9HYPH|nr:sugar kinase [Jiella pelagia]WAP67467.1 sugar kinase [Jiella pelagia]